MRPLLNPFPLLHATLLQHHLYCGTILMTKHTSCVKTFSVIAAVLLFAYVSHSICSLQDGTTSLKLQSRNDMQSAYAGLQYLFAWCLCAQNAVGKDFMLG